MRVPSQRKVPTLLEIRENPGGSPFNVATPSSKFSSLVKRSSSRTLQPKVTMTTNESSLHSGFNFNLLVAVARIKSRFLISASRTEAPEIFSHGSFVLRGGGGGGGGGVGGVGGGIGGIGGGGLWSPWRCRQFFILSPAWLAAAERSADKRAS